MSTPHLKQSAVTLNQLVALYEVMIKNQDEENANKILDLYEKKKKEEKVISFAGHFSAGKSSMINALMGEEILPKSPIPTSANIVKLTSGEGIARIYFHNDNPIEYSEPYDLEVIKDYCKDKDTISKIELGTSRDIIPENSAIFDTPGIDAADDTDRLITESSLHVVDYMFYVVDYNHVQSEVNLQFLQAIQQMNIPYRLIINQIDKHNEQEIPFLSFRKNIKQTFDQWQLFPESVYFTSLLDNSVSHNQLNELKDDVFSLLNDKIEYVSQINNSVDNIIVKHKTHLKSILDEKVNELNIVHQDHSNSKDDLSKLDSLIHEINNKPGEVESSFRVALNHTFKNAYLMPANLREKAELFLESEQRDFKVGLFGSKRKTSIVKENRSQDFLFSLQKSIESNLHWKVRDKLQQLVKEHHLENSNLMQAIQKIRIDYTIEDLQRLTKPGAKINGDYVLNYTNDVTANIIQKYKQAVNPVFEIVCDLTKQKWSEKLTGYKHEKKTIEKNIEDNNKVLYLEKSLEDKLTEIENQISHPKITQDNIDIINYKISQKYDSITKAEKEDRLTQKTDTFIKSDNVISQSVHENKRTAETTIQSIDDTIEIISHLPGFQSVIDELKDRQERLRNQKFTIALFGAFSAGKSSFANALLGSRLLPTSPNPTTAVINKITASTQSHKHSTVKIKLKDEQTLLNDIKPIVKTISSRTQDLTTFTSMIHWIKENNKQIKKQVTHIYQSFLNAILDGYEDNKQMIGQNAEINIDDFSNYVTDETKACYIEEVTLYYDCPLTQKGITLVDTPGADSINARHTNVSFDYIKHADSILYVTYYNHALSRADKDFLQQLGRVKEAFELDKMNFIINASDLAENNEELNIVTEYVEGQLLGLGIRQPKIYTLSSKKAMEDLINNQNNKQMNQFQSDLFNFIDYDLTGVIIQSALYEMNRAKHTLANFIETINLDKQEKEQRRRNLLKSQEEMEIIINKLPYDLYMTRLEQKTTKQLYYVEDRLSIRFHDMFKEKFNPTTINQVGRNAKFQLENSMQQLLDYVGYELLQEIRAVALRMEAYMRELFQEANKELVASMNKIDSNFIPSSINELNWETPRFNKAFHDLDITVFKDDLAIFKGTKSFFVKNEKDIMKEAIYDSLTPSIKNYIEEAQKEMNQSYSKQWLNSMTNRRKDMAKEMSSFVDNSLEMISNTSNINELKTMYSKMNQILS